MGLVTSREGAGGEWEEKGRGNGRGRSSWSCGVRRAELENGQNIVLGDFCKRPVASAGCLGAEGSARLLARHYKP